MCWLTTPGWGMLNALEGASREAIADLFATNTPGTIAMTQAVIPRFRARRSGTIVNITSAVTLQPMPLLAVYTASKAAVNAFTESLALELRAFNIRVGLILPGRAPRPASGKRSSNDGPAPGELCGARPADLRQHAG